MTTGKRGEHPAVPGPSSQWRRRLRDYRESTTPAGSVHWEVDAMAYRQAVHIEAPVEKLIGFFGDPGNWRSAAPKGIEFKDVRLTRVRRTHLPHSARQAVRNVAVSRSGCRSTGNLAADRW